MPTDRNPGPGGVFDEGSRAERRRAHHFDRTSRPRMTDATGLPVTPHHAQAEAEVGMAHETLSAIIDGTTGRGDVLSVAEMAGVVAAKRTDELIPLAHPAGLTQLVVSAVPDRAAGAVRIRSETAAVARADQAGEEMKIYADQVHVALENGIEAVDQTSTGMRRIREAVEEHRQRLDPQLTLPLSDRSR